MKVTVHRLLAAVFALDVALFLVSGIPRFKDAAHGADYVVGEVVWFGFLAGALAFVVLAGVATTRTLRRRREANA